MKISASLSSALVLTVALLASCAPYSDLTDGLTAMNKAIETLAKDGGSATDSQSAAAAIGVYAQAVKTHGDQVSRAVEQAAPILASPPADFPEAARKAAEAFANNGPTLAGAVMKINTDYGTDKAVLDAWSAHYKPLKEAIDALNKRTATFAAEMGAAADGKAAAAKLTAFSAEFRTLQKAMNRLRPLYPELSFLDSLPNTLMVSSHDYGQVSAQVTEAMAKLDTWSTDADVQKALEARYAPLKKSFDQMVTTAKTFIEAMKAAKDAKAAAAALEGFALGMSAGQRDVALDLGQLPELSQKTMEEFPSSVSSTLKTMIGLGEDIKSAIAKTEPWQDDPAVQAAMARVNS